MTMGKEENSYTVCTRKVAVTCVSEEWVGGAYKRRSGKKRKSKMKMQETFQCGTVFQGDKKPKGFNTRWHDLKQWAKKAYRKAKSRRKSETTEETTNTTTEKAEKTDDNSDRHSKLENTEERTSHSDCQKAEKTDDNSDRHSKLENTEERTSHSDCQQVFTKSSPIKAKSCNFKTRGTNEPSPTNTFSGVYKSRCAETHSSQHQTMVKETHEHANLQRQLCRESDDSKKVAIKSSQTQTDSLSEKECTVCHHQRIREEHSDHSDDNNPKSTEDLPEVPQGEKDADLEAASFILSTSSAEAGCTSSPKMNSICVDVDLVETCPTENMEEKSSTLYCKGEKDSDLEATSFILSTSSAEAGCTSSLKMNSICVDVDSVETCPTENLEEKNSTLYCKEEKDSDLEATSFILSTSSAEAGCTSSLKSEVICTEGLTTLAYKTSDPVAAASTPIFGFDFCRSLEAQGEKDSYIETTSLSRITPSDAEGFTSYLQGEKDSDIETTSLIRITPSDAEGFTSYLQGEKDSDIETTSLIRITPSDAEGFTSYLQGEKDSDIETTSLIRITPSDAEGFTSYLQGEKDSDIETTSLIRITPSDAEGFTSYLQGEKDSDIETTSLIRITPSDAEGFTSYMYLQAGVINSEELKILATKINDFPAGSMPSTLENQIIFTIVDKPLSNNANGVSPKKTFNTGFQPRRQTRRRRINLLIHGKYNIEAGVYQMPYPTIIFTIVDKPLSNNANGVSPKKTFNTGFQPRRQTRRRRINLLIHGKYNIEAGVYQMPYPTVLHTSSSGSKIMVDISLKELVEMFQFPEKYHLKRLNGDRLLVDDKNRLKKGIYIVTDEDFRNAATDSGERRLITIMFHPGDCRLPVGIPVCSEEYLGRKAELYLLIEETERMRDVVQRQLNGEPP